MRGQAVSVYVVLAMFAGWCLVAAGGMAVADCNTMGCDCDEEEGCDCPAASACACGHDGCWCDDYGECEGAPACAGSACACGGYGCACPNYCDSGMPACGDATKGCDVYGCDPGDPLSCTCQDMCDDYLGAPPCGGDTQCACGHDGCDCVSYCPEGAPDCGGQSMPCACSDYCDCPDVCTSAHETLCADMTELCDCGEGGNQGCPQTGEKCAEVCLYWTRPTACTDVTRQCACGGDECPNSMSGTCERSWCSEYDQIPPDPWTGDCGGAVLCPSLGCVMVNCFCPEYYCPEGSIGGAGGPCMGMQHTCAEGGCGGSGCETVTPPACGWECDDPCECEGGGGPCECEGDTTKNCVDHCGDEPCGDKVDCVCGGLVCVYIDDNNTPDDPSDDFEGRFCEKHCSKATDDAALRPCGGKTRCDCGCCCLENPGAGCCDRLECTVEVCKRAAAQE